MKNSLRVIGISIFFLSGFYSVSAKAASTINADTDFNSILNNNVAVYLDIDDYHNITIPAIPAAINETHDTTGISSFGLPKFKESFSTDADTNSDIELRGHEKAVHNTDEFKDIIDPGSADDTRDAAGISSFGLPKYDDSIASGADSDSDAKLDDHEKTGIDADYYQEPAVSRATDDTNGMTGISSFGLPASDAGIANLELLEAENITPASSAGTVSQSVIVNETNPSSIENVSLEKAADLGSKFSKNASNDENGKFVPELEIYAMLLVFLGLMAFTARRRRDII